MKGFTQSDKLLRIQSILDSDPDEKKCVGDPLLLTKLDGQEGISTLFAYDVTILRDARSEARPPLKLARLMYTAVDLGVRNSTDEPFRYRRGVIETIESAFDLDEVHSGPIIGAIIEARSFRVYKAHVVPAVKLLAREAAFRVFENKTVLDILKLIKEDGERSFPKLVYIDLSALEGQKFPTMAYCVQFGETTFDFMCRIMARFGVGYFFGHSLGPEGLMNDTMVLRRYDSFKFPSCAEKKMTRDDDPASDAVSGLSTFRHPAQRRTETGGFNQMTPRFPYVGAEVIDPNHDLLTIDGRTASDTQWFSTTTFGESVALNQEAKDRAAVSQREGQACTFSIGGKSRNASFAAGHSFEIAAKDDKQPEPARGTYVIYAMQVNAHDFNYDNLPGWQFLDIFFNTYSTVDSDPGSMRDAALFKVSTWVSNAAQNWSPPVWSNDTYFNNPTAPGVINVPGKAPWNLFSQPMWALMWLCVQGIDLKKMANNWSNETSYANGFQAIPLMASNGAAMQSFPLPLFTRPVARGVHSAVVIGPHGADATDQDLYVDVLGRVRVRFPWDPGPATGADKLPRRLAESRWSKAENTCWVRVSEGWAGRGFGTQFLPRIGQEVIVAFIDGDPEQPIIVGRAYNAEGAHTNLPFPAEATSKKVLDSSASLANTESPDYLRSGIRTRSSPRPENGDERFHLLRFDDSYGSEQLLLRSQGRLDVTAKASCYETTYGNRHVRVDASKDKYAKVKGGGSFATVAGEYNLHVGDFRYECVEKGYQLRVKGDTELDLKGHVTAVVGGTLSLNAPTIVIEAMTKLTLKVGGSTIVLNESGVYLDGPMIYKQCVGPADKAADATIKDIADAAKADPADAVGSGPAKPSHGGPRKTETVHAQHGLELPPDPSRNVCVPLAAICAEPEPAL